MTKKYKKKAKLKLSVRIGLLVAITLILVQGLLFVYEGMTRNKNNKTIYAYAIKQNLNYEVELYKNSIFEVDKLEMNQTYVSNVVKNINANFNYEYSNSRNIPLVYSYIVTGKVVAEYILPDEDKKSSLWSKEYEILSKKISETTGNIIELNDSFVIDYDYFNSIASDLRNQIKLPITSYISIDVKISVNGSVGRKAVNDTQIINLKFPLQQQAFKITNKYNDTYFNEIKLWGEEELNKKIRREVIGFVLIAIALSLFIVFVLL